MDSLRGAGWRDVRHSRTTACASLLQCVGNELRAIVHPQVSRRWIQLEWLLDCVDHINSPTAAANPNSQADAAEFIHHFQELERVAIHRLIELEVECPVAWE